MAQVDAEVRGMTGRDLIRKAFIHAEEPYLTRFLEDVEISGSHWLWTGRVNPSGYGVFSIHGQTVGAHRVAYEWAHGPLHSWMEVDHTDRTPLCVYPSHLEEVTHLENVRRGDVCEMLRRNTHPLATHLFNREISIADFAASVFATPRMISRMLNGHRPSDPDLVYRIGAALGFSWEETDIAFPRRNVA